jgi:hypothetical protein
MSQRPLHATVFALAAAIALHGSSAASTYVVDVAGSGQFFDIPPAIAAAQDGDVLLVMPGNYSGFTADKGVTIIGYGAVVIQSSAAATGVGSSTHAALVNLRPPVLRVHDCAGAVIVQDFPVPLGQLEVTHSSDVRMRGVAVLTPRVHYTLHACTVEAARAEIVDSQLVASQALMLPNFTHVDGGAGVQCNPFSRVHFVLSSSHGGAGSDTNQQFNMAGFGGAGIYEEAGASLVIAGDASDVIQGGQNGVCLACSDCSYDGAGAGDGLDAYGQCAYSGASILAQSYLFGHQCLPDSSFAIVGNATQVVPDDPTLDISGTPSAGQTVTFTLHADPGASAILFFGRQAIVVPDPNVEIELLTPKSRIVNLGTIPPSGVATFHWPINAGLSPGVFFVAQAEVTGPSSVGALRRTNSIPIVLR